MYVSTALPQVPRPMYVLMHAFICVDVQAVCVRVSAYVFVKEILQGLTHTHSHTCICTRKGINTHHHTYTQKHRVDDATYGEFREHQPTVEAFGVVDRLLHMQV
jgi:hypothetical protein